MRVALLAFSPFSRLVCRAKEALYGRGVLKAARAPLPVVAVGNLAFGGTGKTPLAAELLARLIGMGHRPALVSRGYRGAWERTGGILSDGKDVRGTWAEGGDEPFMIARRFPAAGVFVGKDRLASCLIARELGFTAVVLDDAFQHRRLARDMDIVLFDPSGRRPLREGPSALGRADIILLRKGGDPAAVRRVRESIPGPAVFEYAVAPRDLVDIRTGRAAAVSSLRGESVFAFCGIAGPRRFLATLEALGAKVAGSMTFPDHFAYPPGALKRIAAAFAASRADHLVTTEKDGVKLAPAGTPLEGLPLRVLRIGLDIDVGFAERFEAAFPKPPGKSADAGPGGPGR